MISDQQELLYFFIYPLSAVGLVTILGVAVCSVASNVRLRLRKLHQKHVTYDPAKPERIRDLDAFAGSIVEGIQWDCQTKLHAEGRTPPFSFVYLVLGSHQPDVRHLIWVEVTYTRKKRWANIIHVSCLCEQHHAVLNLVSKKLKAKKYYVTVKPCDEGMSKDLEIIGKREAVDYNGNLITITDYRVHINR